MDCWIAELLVAGLLHHHLTVIVIITIVKYSCDGDKATDQAQMDSLSFPRSLEHHDIHDTTSTTPECRGQYGGLAEAEPPNIIY